MNLYKINKQYSIFLFFFNMFIIFTASEVIEAKEIVISYKTVICFFLVSIIGVSHGALDHTKGYVLMKVYKIQNKYFFYPIYFFCCLLVIFFWIGLPLIALILFLLVASHHFGKEDSYVGRATKKKFINILYLLKGSLVVIAPLLFHTDETLQIFQILNVDLLPPHENFLLASLLISFIANFIIMNHTNNGGFFLLDWITILSFNVFFSPLVAFTIYFCFLHSVRHSFGLINELNRNNFKDGLNMFLKKALPLTVVTAVLFIVSVYILTNYYVLDDAILKVIFIGLASLTFPHILLEYLVEKNEK
ncbi:Brp/Blh family beta-carotene 15,15'-dioxygenase [Candidatus Pelagibacter sp.]|nr:Brp/Blh family beta-carotene 15,15'-dioxygenase [Candidatus Pelagibacter sp.]